MMSMHGHSPEYATTATSAIDYETDTVIQTSLRQQLGKDVTLLTVAHRLQTIMDADKIVRSIAANMLLVFSHVVLQMVLDAGRLVEFDTPSALLKKEHGYFKALVDESGDKDALRAMVKAKAK